MKEWNIIKDPMENKKIIKIYHKKLYVTDLLTQLKWTKTLNDTTTKTHTRRNR